MCCDAVCGGGVEREQWHLLHSLLDFSHSLCYPPSNWAHLVLIPECVGLCTFWDPVGLSNELCCEAGSFSCCRLNPHLFPLCWSPGLWGLSPGPPAAALLELPAAALLGVVSSRLPVSAPPTGLGECFFFISLVVRLPYSSIFWQLWLFFVFKLLSFFWLCKEAQCVYLCLHLGRKS